MEEHKDRVAAKLAIAAGLSLEESHEILRQLAFIVKDLLQHTSAAEYMRQLFPLLKQIAAGHPETADVLARNLNGAADLGMQYSRAAAAAILAQTERDAASGRWPPASIAEILQEARRWKSEKERAEEAAARSPRRRGRVLSLDIHHRAAMDFFQRLTDRRAAVEGERSYGKEIGRQSQSDQEHYRAKPEDEEEDFAESEEEEEEEEEEEPDLAESEIEADHGSGRPGLFRAKNANEYRVWFGTNREVLKKENPAFGFSGVRSHQVRYGHCDVYVPKSHKIGSIGSSPLIRLLRWTDDRLQLRHLACAEPDDFWTALTDQLGRVPTGERHAVIFIHGYNVSFEDAAIRAAQLGFDLGINGAMAFFSWPSRGSVDHYPTDSASIEASEPAITQFLVDFAERSGAEAVHVIAHSMGNRGVLRAVARMAQDAERRTGLPFANFILAAPDVDADTFRHLAAAYGAVAKRTTLYISEKDRAVALSRWLHDYARVGFAPPVSVFAGIDTVNVTNIDLTILGHGYVAEAREVLADMHTLIHEGLPPARRFSLRQAETEEGERYWSIGA